MVGLFAGPAHAGLFVSIHNQTFDGDPKKFIFKAGESIKMEFHCKVAFEYAGKPYRYIIFELQPLKKPATILYIATTYKKKSIEGTSCYGNQEIVLPEHGSKYRLRYHEVPYFDTEPLANADSGQFLLQGDIIKMRSYYERNGDSIRDLRQLQTVASGGVVPSSDLLTIYWHKRKEQIDAAINNNLPPTFEWRKGEDSSPLATNISYAYRLDPLEEWSSYSQTTKATYYFLTPGNYSFKVKAKYKVKGVEKETPEAIYPIRITKVISRPPPLDLTPLSSAQLEHFRQQTHYIASRALLIGVTEYQHYPPLPWVKNDVGRFDTILKQHGFSTQIVDSSTSFDKIHDATAKFISDSQAGERVIIYFSGHGGAEGLKNFLAPSDCNSQTVEHCIPYEMLQQWINQLSEEKKVKHLLVIVDACQAGLGLYSKSSSTSSLEELAKYRGAHMMTAGLMGQNAQIDVEKQTSVFTEMLTKGLEGQADLIKDKVLTLSELLAFVQGGVSQHIAKINPNEQQTPNMGKVRGAGEMLFFLRP